MSPDVRCGAELVLPPAAERCQLYAGHEGDHALLVVMADERQLLRWRRGGHSAEPLSDGMPYQLPWAPSCPEAVVRPAAPPALGPQRGHLRSVAS